MTNDLSLEGYKWINRLVVTSAHEKKLQEAELQKDPELTKELKLTVVGLEPIQLYDFKEAHDLEGGRYFLVELDGRVVQKSEEVFTLEQLNRTIDSLPMRQAELQARQGEVAAH